ncbi:hypothetical protein [Acinetobacter tandoii]|jgi:hypothetical protein|uniref:Uncharacterized protein n=1 Tax=Acinetobacter tandoii DSM 14970 = CIP 107469 TaxID=1120927 RepID=R9AUI7_9GAMM|nr:hypothetical protein [Acinetobacter tandoii]EOR05848.1 hypothetical protein I593_02666 [Acinetobacter tandoii DSM 14970 = CIP 107469]
MLELDEIGEAENVASLQNTLEEAKLLEEKKEGSSTDWSSGMDLVDIGSAIIEAVGDIISNIDIDL